MTEQTNATPPAEVPTGFDQRSAWQFVRGLGEWVSQLDQLKCVIQSAAKVAASGSDAARDATRAELLDLFEQVERGSCSLAKCDSSVQDAMQRVLREATAADESALTVRIGELDADVRVLDAWFVDPNRV
jgi:hypothetical protein